MVIEWRLFVLSQVGLLILASLTTASSDNRAIFGYLSGQLEGTRLLLEQLEAITESVCSQHIYSRGGPYGDLTPAAGSCNATKRDCLELYENGCDIDGVYLIDPSQTGKVIRAYCDMTANGGGWTVFQRRVDDTVNFFRNWDAYGQGFGSLTGNMWLGLESIYQLTQSNDGEISELHIYLESFDDENRFAKYSNFYLDDYKDLYRMHVSGYYGTAGDGLTGHNNSRFSAYDLDLDTHSSLNCASQFNGAWWYKSCHSSNLNGFYLAGAHSSYANGVNYSPWKGHYYSLKTTVMKVRRHPSK